ncbi:MAG: glycosyltransferase, partial [Acidobacteriota bacterium]|nr:glycosyltransferase [Acidobacteriota bacterium]
RGHRVELLVPGPVTGAGDSAAIQAYYQVRGELTVHLLRWRCHGLRALEKWSHAMRAPWHPAVAAAEIVYTRNLPGAWRFLLAGKPVVYEHFRPWGAQIPPLQPFLRSILRHPNLVGAIFHSGHALASYRGLGVPDDRMLVAHNGWDPARMDPPLERAEARLRLGLEPARFTVVYSGRMNARKGLAIILEAARSAPEIHFVLVGSEGEGPVETEARGIPNVRVVPWQRFGDLAPWLYAADVLVIPPSLEPLQRHGNTVLPIKLFLYLAAGRVVLAPDAPDTAELLSDGVNAALIPAGDAQATVATLRALAADPARSERLAAGARRTAAGLTWDVRAATIEAFLHRRLTHPTGPPCDDPWSVRRWVVDCCRWALHR